MKAMTREQFKKILMPIIEFNSKQTLLEKEFGIFMHDKYVEHLYISIDTLFECIFEDYEIDYINKFIYDDAYKTNGSKESINNELNIIYTNIVNKQI